jgi:hypothetical protein
VPTTLAGARLDTESTPSVCSTGTPIRMVRGAALVCRCAAIEAGGAATVDPFMPGEFPNNRWTPPVGLSPKRKCRARVGVSN